MNLVILNSLESLKEFTADTIIDVRAPAEYADDHLPGAINLPVLDDTQRAEIGTVYKRNPFMARKKGAALVALNAANHLQGPLAAKDGGWQPLIYCGVAGKDLAHCYNPRASRLASATTGGWLSKLSPRGSKGTLRQTTSTSLMLIGGSTGTAKTALLHQLAAKGAQILDLEGIATHRGSLFGGICLDQPTQKMFESRISSKLSSLNPAKITFIEAESSKIGERLIPPSLWASMRAAPRFQVTSTLEARSDFLCKTYTDLTHDKVTLCELINRLRPYHNRKQVTEWLGHVKLGEWKKLAIGLITKHYDPRYAKYTDIKDTTVHSIELSDLSDSTLSKTAKTLIGQFN